MSISDISSRFWGDPANCVDELRILRARLEQAEKEQKERARRRKARRIRKLTKQAMNRQLKGQK